MVGTWTAVVGRFFVKRVRRLRTGKRILPRPTSRRIVVAVVALSPLSWAVPRVSTSANSSVDISPGVHSRSVSKANERTGGTSRRRSKVVVRARDFGSQLLFAVVRLSGSSSDIKSIVFVVLNFVEFRVSYRGSLRERNFKKKNSPVPTTLFNLIHLNVERKTKFQLCYIEKNQNVIMTLTLVMSLLKFN